MKLTETTLLAAFFGAMIATASFAAEPTAEVFRAAGCDVETLAPVMSADGETVLYWQNINGGGCAAYSGNDVKPTILETIERFRREAAQAAKELPAS